MREYRETRCAIMSKSSQIFQCCSNAGLDKTEEKGQYLHDT